MAKQPGPTTTIQYVDRPEISETFADSIHTIGFDASGMKIEFCVTRMVEPTEGSPVTQRRYTALRLVLPPNTGIELSDRLKALVALMEKDASIKRPPPIKDPPKTVQ